MHAKGAIRGAHHQAPPAILLRGLSGAFADAQRGHRGGRLRGRGALHRTVIDIPYVQIYGLLLGRSRSHQIEGHPPPFCERVVKRGEAAQRGWMTRWIVCDTSRGGLLSAGLQGQLEAFSRALTGLRLTQAAGP